MRTVKRTNYFPKRGAKKMLDKKLCELLNEQINMELHSAYIYYEIANYYGVEGLDGFQNWFNVQTKEELSHAELIKDYLIIHGVKPVLTAINAPGANYSDHKTPLEAALNHERLVTASIYEIYDCALSKKDFGTVDFLNWFVKEQVEEENNASTLISKYELFGTDARGLYALDQELGARVYTPPTLVVG